ncbi:MAG TPA: hypothetical protein VL754_05720 [Verrucomicrobiae bacterium]|jgi:hypothetical protein|nr:hypothetical protein [Verrucomicrobiae bacterium]
MIFPRAPFFLPVLLILLALQQSCGTNRLAQTSIPVPAEATDQAELAKADAEPQKPQQEPPPAVAAPTPAKPLLPESLLTPPLKEAAAAGTPYDTRVLSRMSGVPLELAWEYRENPQGMIVGFNFSNWGGNRILPERHNVDRNLFFTRDFQFRFDDRARQDIHLAVSDWAPSRDRQFRLSELMNSVFHFFPRRYVPAIATADGRSIVTLPTGEEVTFDAKTHEILNGVLAEAPVDLTSDRTKRHFAALDYEGKGLVVRADARGADPRLGTTATISAAAPDCAEAGCKKLCRVASRELWEQKGAVRFKFSTDEEFDRYLIAHCGFGIPQAEPEVVALR